MLDCGLIATDYRFASIGGGPRISPILDGFPPSPRCQPWWNREGANEGRQSHGGPFAFGVRVFLQPDRRAAFDRVARQPRTNNRSGMQGTIVPIALGAFTVLYMGCWLLL